MAVGCNERVPRRRSFALSTFEDGQPNVAHQGIDLLGASGEGVTILKEELGASIRVIKPLKRVTFVRVKVKLDFFAPLVDGLMVTCGADLVSSLLCFVTTHE